MEFCDATSLKDAESKSINVLDSQTSDCNKETSKTTKMEHDRPLPGNYIYEEAFCLPFNYLIRYLQLILRA